MYKVFEGRNGNQLYHEVLAYVQSRGQKVAPRGKPTLEVQGITTILQPRERVLTVPGRGNNPFFNVAENLAILHGLTNQRDFLVQFNKNWANFFDNDTDKSQWGFYGVRLRKWRAILDEKSYPVMVDQLQEITSKLLVDRDSRQGVAALWHPWLDNSPGHKDYPCNWGVMFKIRENKLNMTVVNRSNDIHWGLFGVNLSQFSFLQETLAAVLGVEIGEQTHMSDSLHLYTEEPTHVEITNRIKQYAPFDIYKLTGARPMFYSQVTWQEIDVALETFFGCWERYGLREDITRGEYVALEKFPFLHDAALVLRAYIFRKDDQMALEQLDGVMDNALWAACVEYLTRLKKYEPAEEDRRFGLLVKSCEDRFSISGMDYVMNYIYHYFWAKQEQSVA